jgi:hypothetical protein
MALVLHRRRDRLPRVAVWLFVVAIAIGVGTALLYSGGVVYLGANPVTGAVSCAAGESHGYWQVFGRCVNIDEFLYLNTLSRAGGLMLGAAFALVWRPVAIMRGPLRRRGRRVDVAALIGLGGIGYLMYARFLLDPASASYDEWLFRGGFFVTGLCTLLCIAAVTHRRSWIGRLMGIRPLNYLGTRSYGMYLFHWPIFQIIRSPGRQLSLTQFAIAMLITVPVTELSYRIIELPVRQGRLGEWLRGERVPRTKAAKRKRTRGFVVGAAVAVVTGFATVSIATASVKCEGQVQCDSQTGEAAIQAAQSSSTTSPSSTTTTSTSVATADTAGVLTPTLPGASQVPTTPAPTTAAPTTTGPLDALSPIAIGESVMLGAAPQLTAAGIRVDAVVSRQGGNTSNVIANYRAQGQLGRIVIIQTGTNGFVMDPVLDSIMASLPADQTPVVVFLTVRAPRRWIDPNNARLRALPLRYPNVKVLDWAELSHQIEGQFAPDGYHLGSLFAKQFYANAIFDAIGHPELKK